MAIPTSHFADPLEYEREAQIRNYQARRYAAEVLGTTSPDPNAAEHRRALERSIAQQLMEEVLKEHADPVETAQKARQMLDTLLGVAPSTAKE